jgi:cell division transport system permease protein
MRLKFVMSEVFAGLWRNLTMTVAMILTAAVSLSLLGAAGLVFRQVEEMKDYFYFQVEMSIFLDKQVTPEQRSALQNELQSDGAVRTATYESKDQAYARFREQFKDTPELVDNVTKDALPESFRVKLNDPTKIQQVAARYTGQPGVDQVADQQRIVGPLFTVLDKLRNAALTIAALQGVAALLLISNTVQVAAYNRRREVGIMKLVGASNWYVRLPFVLEAAIAGLIGAVIATIGLALAKAFLIDGILNSALSGVVPTWGWDWIAFTGPILIGIAVLLGAVTGWLTLRFYVKV